MSMMAKMPKQYDYTVSAHRTARFPIDMLRYDCAWPYSEADARMIEEDVGSRVAIPLAAGADNRIKVRLSSIKNPTAARWETFGWTVVV